MIPWHFVIFLLHCIGPLRASLWFWESEFDTWRQGLDCFKCLWVFEKHKYNVCMLWRIQYILLSNETSMPTKMTTEYNILLLHICYLSYLLQIIWPNLIKVQSIVNLKLVLMFRWTVEIQYILLSNKTLMMTKMTLE